MKNSFFALLVLLWAGVTSAQAPLRDPTAWPSSVQAPAAVEPGSAEDPAAPRVQQVIVVDGHAYLVAGGRRYGVGAKFRRALIVRIDDQAVWLREGTVTRREAFYPGVEKRASNEQAVPTPLPAAMKNKKTERASPERPPQEKS